MDRILIFALAGFLTSGFCIVSAPTPEAVQQAYLKASNTDPFDSFGYEVAIERDTLVIGVPFEASASLGVNGDQTDNSAPNSGAAYVFVRNGTNWTQQAYLKAPGVITDNNGYRFGIRKNL